MGPQNEETPGTLPLRPVNTDGPTDRAVPTRDQLLRAYGIPAVHCIKCGNRIDEFCAKVMGGVYCRACLNRGMENLLNECAKPSSGESIAGAGDEDDDAGPFSFGDRLAVSFTVAAICISAICIGWTLWAWVAR